MYYYAGRSLSFPIPESTTPKSGASNSPPIGDVSSVEANNEAAVVCTTQSNSKFEYLNTEGMSEAQRDFFCGRLELDYKEIANKFAFLHNSISLSLIGNGVSPDDLVTSLRGMKENGIREDKNFNYKDLKKCDTVEEIFDHLVDHYLSVFSFDLLKHIASRFNIKSELEAYETELEEYCRRNVFECPWNKDDIEQSGDNLVIKVDDVDKAEFTVKTIRRLKASVAKILSIRYCLKICCISKGCIEITFSLPEFIPVHVFPLNLDQLEALSRLGVCRLKCDKWSYDIKEEITLQVHIYLRLIILLQGYRLFFSTLRVCNKVTPIWLSTPENADTQCCIA